MRRTPVPDAFADCSVVKPAARGRAGVVAAQNRKAAAVAVAVLEEGGNAFDATIALALALGATEPWMSGMGGIGCALLFDAGAATCHALDFGAVAPRALDPADYPLSGRPAGDLFPWPGVVEDRNIEGPLAIAVPGQLDGLRLLHERFASRPWRELVAPARALAAEGLEVDWWTSLMVTAHAEELRRFATTAAVWLPRGLPPRPDPAGGTLRLPLGRLADTYEAIAEEGPRSFYEGAVAEEVLADLRGFGARLDAGDLRSYRAGFAEPVACARGATRLWAMPGRFAGTTFARCIALLADFPVGTGAPDAPFFEAVADALLRAYAERLAGEGPEGCTSHFCVIDRHGNMAAWTQTLLSVFGSRLLLPRTGLLLNNGIYWFDPRPGRPNALAPGARPLSNMCPVIGESTVGRFALGASGGRRILPAVLQLALFLGERGLSLEEAFHHPRIDVSGAERITADPRLGEAVLQALATRPLDLQPARHFPLAYACPSGALATPQGERQAVAEPWQPWAGGLAEPDRPKEAP